MTFKKDLFYLDFSYNHRGWMDIPELFRFLATIFPGIWLEYVKIGIFKTNLATLFRNTRVTPYDGHAGDA